MIKGEWYVKMLYDQNWHVTLGAQTNRSANVILSRLIEIFDIGSTVDIGCGHGHWGACALSIGISEVVCVDGPWTDRDALVVPENAFVSADLSKPLTLNRKFDLAISTEVAEHLPLMAAEPFIDNLVRHSDLVLFAAAIPNQGGYQHINEQWPSYWISLFEAKGYRAFDVIRPQIWNMQELHYFYRQNCLIYVNKSAAEVIRKAEAKAVDIARNFRPLDLVHPSKWEDVSNYDTISFRRLLPKLPRAFKAHLRGRLW